MSQNDNAETLRQTLLNDVYAGAFGGGMPAMLLDEDEIRNADEEDLQAIARRYGYR